LLGVRRLGVRLLLIRGLGVHNAGPAATRRP
jgi:hypothetical protein